MPNQIVFLCSKTNEHIGLWNDLKSDDRVLLRCVKPRHAGSVLSFVIRLLLKINKRALKNSLFLMWYGCSDLFKLVKSADHLVVVDGVLDCIEPWDLERCRKKNPHIKISLYLLNSVNASSPIMERIRKKIFLFPWNRVYTFDKDDAKKYGFVYAGFMYYSKQELPWVEPSCDIHFVGGLKGNREPLINSTYSFLKDNGFKCDFNLMFMTQNEQKQVLEGATYYRGWRPYDFVLKKMNESRCILEICQEGQSGASLRYFEAVCYNKKLLTNNKMIVDFPYYNPNYMRCFQRIDDIDVEWLRNEKNVDYGYRGDFSPKKFIDFLLGAKNEKV